MGYRVTQKPAPILTRSKKDRPDDPFCIIFFRRDIGAQCTALISSIHIFLRKSMGAIQHVLAEICFYFITTIFLYLLEYNFKNREQHGINCNRFRRLATIRPILRQINTL